MQELQKRLQKEYGKKTIKNDPFGRRIALPSEIQAILQTPHTYDQLVDRYLPTELDIAEKNDRTKGRLSR